MLLIGEGLLAFARGLDGDLHLVRGDVVAHLLLIIATGSVVGRVVITLRVLHRTTILGIVANQCAVLLRDRFPICNVLDSVRIGSGEADLRPKRRQMHDGKRSRVWQLCVCRWMDIRGKETQR